MNHHANRNVTRADGLDDWPATPDARYLTQDGAQTGASSQAQTFTNGLITGDISPDADSAIAIRLWNAARTVASAIVNTVANTVTLGGRVGVNVIPGAQRLVISGEVGDDSILHLLGTTDGYGLNASFEVDTGGSNGIAFRLVPEFTIDDAVTQHIVLNNNAFLAGDETLTSLVGQYLRAQVSSGNAVNLTTYIALQVAPSVFAGSGGITNKYGLLFSNDTVATGAVRALFLQQNSGSGNYNIYASGTADNYLNGDTGIGVASPDAKLHVDGTVIFDSLPTSDPANSGQLWNDSGTLKVSGG